jgi:uncharacterized protein YuzE
MDGTYDPEVDAATLRFVPQLEPGSSQRQVVLQANGLAEELVLDLDDEGRILAIEVLGASRVLRAETIAELDRLATP